MNKTMTTIMHPEQSLRRQMSLMAWIMCGLCAWIIMLSATAVGENYRHAKHETAIQRIDVTADR